MSKFTHRLKINAFGRVLDISNRLTSQAVLEAGFGNEQKPALKPALKTPIFAVQHQDMTTEHKKLTNLQVELLKLFAYDLSDEQLLEIKALLANYFAEKASDRMDELWEERGWTPETMEEWGKEPIS